MRVVSLVPSWTETLIDGGIRPVGRTRYCIHPMDQVKNIEIVGGTKTLDFAKLKSLKPDLLILDKEENPAGFGQLGIPYVVSHIRQPEDVLGSLRALQKVFPESQFSDQIKVWERLNLKKPKEFSSEWDQLPGVIEWIEKPEGKIDSIYYVIWKNPWMIVSSDTYIGGVLSRLGFAKYLKKYSHQYPEIQLEDLDCENSLFLFSSEPYPFLKEKESLKGLGLKSAIVDGESFSWFGLRSQKFLNKNIK